MQEIKINDEKEAQLTWAFSIIFNFMKENNLDEIQSKLVPLKVYKE